MSGFMAHPRDIVCSKLSGSISIPSKNVPENPVKIRSGSKPNPATSTASFWVAGREATPTFAVTPEPPNAIYSTKASAGSPNPSDNSIVNPVGSKLT